MFVKVCFPSRELSHFRHELFELLVLTEVAQTAILYVSNETSSRDEKQTLRLKANITFPIGYFAAVVQAVTTITPMSQLTVGKNDNLVAQ